MNELALKALATVILVAGLIFGFNVFVDHQRDIGYWAEKTAEQQAPDYRAKFDEESQ